MKALIQRVTYARVIIDGIIFSNIDQGILALIGIMQTDTKKSVMNLTEKILNYRIFNDINSKMNLNVQQITGEILFVPQFTLVSNTTKGLRPNFSKCGSPEHSKLLFDYLVNHAKQIYTGIKIGKFGANMQIELCNNGPVSFMLEN